MFHEEENKSHTFVRSQAHNVFASNTECKHNLAHGGGNSENVLLFCI